MFSTILFIKFGAVCVRHHLADFSNRNMEESGTISGTISGTLSKPLTAIEWEGWVVYSEDEIVENLAVQYALACISITYCKEFIRRKAKTEHENLDFDSANKYFITNCF